MLKLKNTQRPFTRLAGFVFRKRFFTYVALAVLVALCSGATRPSVRNFNVDSQANHKQGSEAPTEVKYLNTVPGVAYVGSKVCGTCHRPIYDQYIRTDMARSMSLPSQRLELDRLASSVTIFDKKLNRYFEVFRQGQDSYEGEYEFDPNGHEIFKHIEKIAYAVGTGENGIGYVIQRRNYLFQAPIAFYTKANAWGLAPGYHSHDFGFTRPIRAACVACHSGLPQPVSDVNGLYKKPPFLELGIGCESCHGPGQLHVEARLKGKPLSGLIDPTIVNLAKLPASLADNVCMFCHQEGDARVLMRGKHFVDFRPGTPLGDTLAIFVVSRRRQSTQNLPFLDYYSEMILSKCYEASHGQLSCLLCHDPHQQLLKSEVSANYRNKCFRCHTDRSCSIPLQERVQQTPPDDCVRCHMPQQNARLLTHTDITNHRIIARQGEPYPSFPSSPIIGQASDLTWLDAVPGKKSPPPLVSLAAYRQVLLQNPDPIFKAHYSQLLNLLAREDQSNAVVLRALAQGAVEEGTLEGRVEAIKYLAQIVSQGSAATTDYLALAELLAQSGQLMKAIGILQKALSSDPYNPSIYELLVSCDMEVGDRLHAAQIAQAGLKLFPESSFLRTQLTEISTNPLAR